MARQLEVYADITCPFTHVGLHRVREALAGRDVVIRVRSWPLEWVNGVPLDADAVAMKAKVLRGQLGVDLFAGFTAETWPETTIPALNLAAAATAADPGLGLAVNLALRDALFEHGRDVADPEVLAEIAGAHGLAAPGREAAATVREEYEEGRRRGVRGSPDFWLGDDEFFCPALTIGHDDAGLTTEFDEAGLQTFLARIDALA